MKNVSCRSSSVAKTPICFQRISVSSGLVRLPSTAGRPRRVSINATSLTATTHVSHLPHSAARHETALPNGDGSDAR